MLSLRPLELPHELGHTTHSLGRGRGHPKLEVHPLGLRKAPRAAVVANLFALRAAGFEDAA